MLKTFDLILSQFKTLLADFRVELAATGIKRDDFQVELDNDVLVIWCEASKTRDDKNAIYTRKEFSYESFRRSFHLPNTMEADKIEEKYQDDC